MSVDHYLLLARSVTYAQRMQKVLDRAGIRCRIFRAPRTLTDMGCAYAVYVAVEDMTTAFDILRRSSLAPVKIFFNQQGMYREVGHDLP